MTSLSPNLENFKEKIEIAVSMVERMSAAEKLRAVQLWNILSEKLQEIVNNSAADINALALQETNTPANTNSHYNGYLPSQAKSQTISSVEENEDFISSNQLSENSAIITKAADREAAEGDSLASFSDINCGGEEDMDDVCPLTLPLSVEEKCKSNEDNLPEENREKTKLYECNECRVSFRTKGHLIDHSRKHTGERPFLCPECGSSFTTASNLKRHMKAHKGMKNFSCQECHAKFLEKKTLLVHMRRHTGEKPYVCQVCNKRFSQLSILQSHLASHDDQRCHLCELCGKAFRQKSQMKTHLLRHKGERRFPCSECSMSFLTKSDFRRHARVHTGERPFSCDQCGKSFTRKETLDEHKNRHFGIKPYTCNLCQKAFSEASAYGKHMKRHTNAMVKTNQD